MKQTKYDKTISQAINLLRDLQRISTHAEDAYLEKIDTVCETLNLGERETLPDLGTNAGRAHSAEVALARFTDNNDIPTQIKDMLSDLMHLAAREGADFEDILDRARNNYEAESDGID